MKVSIRPSRASGTISAPPSKSMAHRLLICAGLCTQGESLIHRVDLSQDILATLDCLSAMGAQYRIDGSDIYMSGCEPMRAQPGRMLCCRESGSTLRFFIPLALLGSEVTGFSGSERLMSRPLGVYEDICSERGLLFSMKDGGLTVRGPLESGVFTLPGDVSSQFITGLLFALPLLEGDSRLQLIPPVESRSYIELSLSALRDFGVSACWQDENTLFIPGGQSYEARETTVEGDYSNAAFLDAFTELGGSVQVTGLREDSLQGDRVYKKHFKSLSEGYAKISLADCPDLGPILFAMAAAEQGATFTDTRRLRIKESDRAQAMALELRKLGAELQVEEDRVIVPACRLHAPDEILCGHNDHRIVMSLAVLLSDLGGSIDGAQAVSKSYPGFFRDMASLGVSVEVEE